MKTVRAKSKSSINIRRVPGGDVLGLLRVGDIATYKTTEVHKGQEWHQVEFNEIKGWVRADVVTVFESYNMISPMAGVIRSKFGPRVHPVTKQPGKFHNGVDIAAPIGREIYSPANGVVSDVYETEFGGKSLIILHDNGLESRMCHLDNWCVEKGQRINQGELVAINGNTGRSTGPHLHYGIRLAGNYLDPQTIIKF